MTFNKNDYVTRKSHDNDIEFMIIDIKDNIAYLKGSEVRLYADAPLDDLIICEHRDEFVPEDTFSLENRDEYFYLPGRILHLDGDIYYLKKSLKYYKKAGVLAIGKQIDEKDMANNIKKLIEDINPDILVITGHDALLNKDDKDDINSYKNSQFFIDSVKEARKVEKSHEKLVIIAGACQSDYEELIKSGANFASSPKRVNIHALDPAIIATNIALTDKDKNMDIKELLSKTRYGASGMGGIIGSGMMYVGYPR